MESRKRALGMGLEQLFNNENLDLEGIEKKIYETTSKEEIVELNINELRPNPYQPRKEFDLEKLQELSNSIKEHGVIQPIIVKKSIKGYEIIAGERRFRASKLAGLESIPAIVRPFTDDQMAEVALLENIQRENLNPIEEAIAYKQLLEKRNLTHETLSVKVGKSRSHVTNTLGLLRLPEEVKELVSKGKISMGHARALSKLENPEEIIRLAHQIDEDSITVRNVEEISKEKDKKIKIAKKEDNNDYKYVEDLLRDRLDTKIKIKDKKIEISFNNVADLNRILEILNIKE